MYLNTGFCVDVSFILLGRNLGGELLHYKFMLNVYRKFQPVFQSEFSVSITSNPFHQQPILFLCAMICEFLLISPAFILLNLFPYILLSLVLLWIEFFCLSFILSNLDTWYFFKILFSFDYTVVNICGKNSHFCPVPNVREKALTLPCWVWR